MRSDYQTRLEKITSLVQVRLFLLLTTLPTFLYATLNILFIIIPQIQILIFLSFFFSLLRDIFYSFLGLLWLSAQYYFFIDPVLISLILGSLGLLQLVVLVKPKFYFSHFYSCSIVFLLFTLTLMPFGLLAIYFLFIVLSNHSAKNDLIKDFPNNQDKKYPLEKAWSRITIMVFNYGIAFWFLNMVQIIRSQASFQSDIVLTVILLICALVCILAFGVLGLLFYNDKLLLDCSTVVSVIAFVFFLFIVVFLNTFYSSIHNEIPFLAPFSILIIFSVLIHWYFRKLNLEGQVIEN